MQGHRTLPPEEATAPATLADLLAAGELTCSAAQVARWMNVSKPTVIADARAGKLPGWQVGKQWRFSVPQLARMWGVEADADDYVPAEAGGFPRRAMTGTARRSRGGWSA